MWEDEEEEKEAEEVRRSGYQKRERKEGTETKHRLKKGNGGEPREMMRGMIVPRVRRKAGPRAQRRGGSRTAPRAAGKSIVRTLICPRACP